MYSSHHKKTSEGILFHIEWLMEDTGYLGKALPVVVSVLMNTVGTECLIKAKYI